MNEQQNKPVAGTEKTSTQENLPKLVLLIDLEDGRTIDGIMSVANWDDEFPQCYDEVCRAWHETLDEFFDTIIPALQARGYIVELMDYEVVRG